ncbi:MAG: XTP/dITP diphosphohydrolase, partial [Myxococcota bacterium]
MGDPLYMQQLVFATRNKHKIREFQDLVAPLGLQAVSLSELAPDAPDVEETGSSFHANARLKAEAAYRLTGLPALADDSGICIDALDGAPGIFSARWAGDSGPDKDESNNDRMLRELEGVPDEKRGAHYACSLVLVCGPDFIRADAPSPATVRTDGAMEVHFQGQLFGRIGY